MGETAQPDNKPLRWMRVGAGIAGTLLLVSSALTGALLTWRYVPVVGSDTLQMDARGRWSYRLVHCHQSSLALALPVLALWLALTAHEVWARGTARRKVGVIGSAVAAMLLTLVTSFVWYLVKWDQVAMQAVTVGDDLKGLWFAAFSDRVMFVLIGGVEVSQRVFAPWVVVHLVAPVLALAAMATALRMNRRDASTTADRSEVGAPLRAQTAMEQPG